MMSGTRIVCGTWFLSWPFTMPLSDVRLSACFAVLTCLHSSAEFSSFFSNFTTFTFGFELEILSCHINNG